MESGSLLRFETRFETTLRSWEGCIDVTSSQNSCVTELAGWRLPSLTPLYHLVELMGGKYWQFLRIWLLWEHFQLSLNLRKWNWERNQNLMRFPPSLMDKSLKPVWPALQPCSQGFPLPQGGVIIYGQPAKSSKTFCWQNEWYRHLHPLALHEVSNTFEIPVDQLQIGIGKVNIAPINGPFYIWMSSCSFCFTISNFMWHHWVSDLHQIKSRKLMPLDPLAKDCNINDA